MVSGSLLLWYVQKLLHVREHCSLKCHAPGCLAKATILRSRKTNFRRGSVGLKKFCSCIIFIHDQILFRSKPLIANLEICFFVDHSNEKNNAFTDCDKFCVVLDFAIFNRDYQFAVVFEFSRFKFFFNFFSSGFSLLRAFFCRADMSARLFLQNFSK